MARSAGYWECTLGASVLLGGLFSYFGSPLPSDHVRNGSRRNTGVTDTSGKRQVGVHGGVCVFYCVALAFRAESNVSLRSLAVDLLRVPTGTGAGRESGEAPTAL